MLQEETAKSSCYYNRSDREPEEKKVSLSDEREGWASTII